jgi:RNA polymerase sigma-70 factor (ECF subfamily)
MSTWTEIAKATKPASTYGIDSDNLDRLLIERIARQDRTAMRQLFERHYARISRFFSGLALDNELTDQLTVETFLTAWDGAANFHRGSPVSIWLLALGNRCLLRSIPAGRHQPGLGDGRIDDSGSQVRFDELSRGDWIRALSDLAIAQRVALRLTYHLGHSCGEVAAIMGSSEANVRQHVFFGRRKLYTLLTVAARHRNEGGVGMPQVQGRALSAGFGGRTLTGICNAVSRSRRTAQSATSSGRSASPNEPLSCWGAHGLKRH